MDWPPKYEQLSYGSDAELVERIASLKGFAVCT